MNVKISSSPLHGEITAISSKSYLHRALIAAFLSDSPTKISCNCISRDVMTTIECLCAAGAKIIVNDTEIEVTPSAFAHTVLLDCGESGSTLRFLLPIMPALGIDAQFIAHGALTHRPVMPVLNELSKKGCTVSDGFPINISGHLQSGNYTLAGNISSQFVTGLLFALPLLNGDSKITLLPPIVSKSYINMTLAVLSDFGISVTKFDNVFFIKGNQHYRSPSRYETDGDWSNAAFWLCSAALKGEITVNGLSTNSLQGDKEILRILSDMGADISADNEKITVRSSPIRGTRINASDIPDLVPVLAVISAFGKGDTVISHAARLRFKESDRLSSTASLICSLGGNAKVTEDGLLISGGLPQGGTVNGFCDHRIVMSAAIAATVCKNGIIISGAEAAEKSYPLFFRDFKLLGGIADVI